MSWLTHFLNETSCTHFQPHPAQQAAEEAEAAQEKAAEEKAAEEAKAIEDANATYKWRYDSAQSSVVATAKALELINDLNEYNKGLDQLF